MYNITHDEWLLDIYIWFFLREKMQWPASFVCQFLKYICGHFALRVITYKYMAYHVLCSCRVVLIHSTTNAGHTNSK